MILHTKKEAAEQLGCSVVTVDKLRRQGKLPCHKVGALVKFTPEDIDAFLQRAAVPAETEA
ncbi:MAG: helix-turn-helix domain-containing protein [Treponema sp.]|nr:helix-turn-helix domain-containing protein [Treponema sp.]